MSPVSTVRQREQLARLRPRHLIVLAYPRTHIVVLVCHALQLQEVVGLPFGVAEAAFDGVPLDAMDDRADRHVKDNEGEAEREDDSESEHIEGAVIGPSSDLIMAHFSGETICRHFNVSATLLSCRPTYVLLRPELYSVYSDTKVMIKFQLPLVVR
jgi:hypothetical protein